MTKDFTVWQHHHHGWTVHHVRADNEIVAQKMAVYESVPWLHEFKHHIIIISEGGYQVICDQLKASFSTTLYPGSHWFSDQIRIGLDDDCEYCGGTGVDHYNSFMSCWSCHGEESVRLS